MKRRRIVRTIAVIVGAMLVVLLSLAIYLRFADLSGWRDTVAEKLSASLGRDVRIAGEFKPEIGRITRLSAGNVTLANPGWCSDPTMASVQRLVFELDLWSLVSGPLTIHNVELEGARVALEKDADGRANWQFDTRTESTPSNKPLDLVLKHALVDDLQVTFRDASRPEPVNAVVTHFETTEDSAGMLEIALDGTLDRREVRLSGKLGPLAGLLNATALDFDLSGGLDSVRFTSKGEIAELKTLRGVDVTAEAHGDDVADLRGLFELPPELGGPFSLSAAVSPASGGSAVQLEAAVSGMTAKVDGTVDSLLEPKVVDATVTASGPSVRTVGSLTGIAGLPDDAFSVTGGVRWEGFPITFRKVEIAVGENSLTADGVLGAPPEMLGTDFTVHGQGSDISTIAALAGIKLPRDSYSIDGRLVRIEGGLDVEKFEALVGRAEFSAHGKVGNPPDYTGTTLYVHAEGPNIAHFNHLIGLDLPPVDFAIEGRFAQGREAITLEGVTARIGTESLRADGSLHTGAHLSGTTLKIEAQGSDATQIMLLRGFMDLPAVPWTAAGGLTFVQSGYMLDRVTATFGEMRVDADGLIAAAKRSVGTNLRLHVEDPDLSDVMSIFKVEGFPHQPVRADGGLKIEDAGYRLDNVSVTAGDIEIAVDGLISHHPDLEGTSGRVSIRGPRLESVGPYFHLSGLPDTVFSVTGDVRVSGRRADLSGVDVVIDSNHITVDGSIGTVRGLVGTDVTIDLKGPDFGRAGRLASGIAKIPDLPAEPFALATRLAIDEAGYVIENLRATLDRAVAKVDGRVGTAAKLVGTNLTVTADGPNASLFSALTGVTIPGAPFQVRGRVERTEAAVVFDRVSIELGGHSISLHGSLGERPRLIGTELDLSASGPGTALIAELTGYDKLPDEPFSLTGHFEGTPEKFTAEGLDLVLGPSDLKGSLEVDIRGKPDVTARLVSDQLHFEGILKPLRDGATAESDGATAPKTALLISNEPIDFGWMQLADADFDITIGTLQAPVERFHDVSVHARLEDGRLEVHRLAMAGSRGGSGSGSMVLEPVGGSHRATLAFKLENVRFQVAGINAPTSATEPPIDVDVNLQVEGASPHEMAASADGSVTVVVGKGEMDNRALDLISQDFLLTLLTAFNPFAKETKATELECAIALFTFDDGLMTLEPMAMQSNKMTMLGAGTINFKTEKLNLDWITKPRKGIGLSASMLTNPYIKLGGTLAKPAIELKGAQAVASTGVAVATLGISIVAKGMLDRATAEKKVCKIALQEIAQRTGDSTGESQKRK